MRSIIKLAIRWRSTGNNWSHTSLSRFIAITMVASSTSALDPQALEPGYTGIRPKIGGPEHPNVDFQILTPSTHGIEGLVHLFGIESPGLTASLSIAEAVVASLDQRLVT